MGNMTGALQHSGSPETALWNCQSQPSRLSSSCKSSPQNRCLYGAKDQSFHNTWLKMLIVFYSALDTKLVTCCCKLLSQLPSPATFVPPSFLARTMLSRISKDVNHYYMCQLTWCLVITFPEENGFWNKTIKNADLLKEESFLYSCISSQLFIHTSSK